MSRCQAGVAAYTPSRTEVSHNQAPVSSPIEEQLLAQHQQPAELVELRRQNGSLLLHDGSALLEGLSCTSTVTPHAAGGVVLGFSVANGAVASQDFPVGKVHKLSHDNICHACSTSMYKHLQACTSMLALPARDMISRVKSDDPLQHCAAAEVKAVPGMRKMQIVVDDTRMGQHSSRFAPRDAVPAGRGGRGRPICSAAAAH